jgi:NADP-dependent 3-hydroxy acid dehydrogenase YdfG
VGWISTVLFSKTLLAARDATRMGEACEQLRKELTATEYTKLRSHTLDIVDAKSCTAFAQFLKKEHDGLDVLVNNAGIAYKVSRRFLRD